MKKKFLGVALLMVMLVGCNNSSSSLESSSISSSSLQTAESSSEKVSSSESENQSSSQIETSSQTEVSSESKQDSSDILSSSSEEISSEEISSSTSSQLQSVGWPSSEVQAAEGQNMTIAEIIEFSKNVGVNSSFSSYSTSVTNNKRSFTFVNDVLPTKVTFQGQYLDRLEKKNPVFVDDNNNVLQAYSIDNDKIENLLDTSTCIGNYYEVTGYVTIYKHKPSILITKTYQQELEDSSFVFVKNGETTNTPKYSKEKLVNTNVADFNKVKPTYEESMSVYSKLYHFNSFLELYTYGSSETLVAVDALNDNVDPFKANYKGIEINNADTASYDILADYYNNSKNVEFDCIVFQWANKNKIAIWEIDVIPTSVK